MSNKEAQSILIQKTQSSQQVQHHENRFQSSNKMIRNSEKWIDMKYFPK